VNLPTNADVIVVHGYWLDELTGVGVKQTNGHPATITFEPVPMLGADTARTPNLRDLTFNTHLKTRTRVATVDPATGYYATLLVASNDPDLDAYGGRRVTFLGEDPFLIEVPYSAPTVTVSAEMAAKTGLAQGSSVKAVWLPDVSVATNPPPTPSVNYLTSSQTLANIASGVEAHDEDPDAHADIRALVQARARLVAAGSVTLAAGSATVANTAITSGSIIRLHRQAAGGTLGQLAVALSAGVGFTVTSSSSSETSGVYYEVVSY
jgi:hypothetical protein